MKKKSFLLLIFLAVSTAGFSQRHLKGQKGAYLNGGISGRGGFAKIGTNYTLSKKLYVTFDLMFESGKVVTYKFQTYNLTGTLYWSPFKPINKIIYLNFGLGLSGNTARIKGAEVELNSGKVSDITSIDIGPHLAFETETFLSKKIAWTITADQRFFVTNNFAKTKKESVVRAWYLGTGLKFLF